MNSQDQRRLLILNRISTGELTVEQASELLQRSTRQIQRILAAYRKEGAAALAHGNRKRRPAHSLDEALCQRVVALARSTYADCNHVHLTELLAEREHIVLSRSSVRRILLRAELAPKRKRRAPKHRSRRERYPQVGMLLQLDASDHDWLQGRGPRLTLLAAIDDATGEVLGALFQAEEDAAGYMRLMRVVISKYGRPLAVYHDRHSIFVVSPQQPRSIAEQLLGQRQPTQFGRMLGELEIAPIAANSPQAKGRVERLFGTLQDRLVVELRLAGATTLAAANAVLQQYLPRFNERFQVQPAEDGVAFRALPAGTDLERICCFKYERVVAADNTVRLGEHRLQLLPSEQRRSWVQARVEVQERLDGSLAVYYQGACLATKPAPAEAPLLRARKARRAMPATAPHEPAGQEQTSIAPSSVAAPAAGTLLGAGRREESAEEQTGGQAVERRRPAKNHPWRAPLKPR